MRLDYIDNMDCLDGLKEIPDKSVDLVCTDPPYFMGMTHNGQKGNFKDLAICRPFYEQLAREFARVLKDDGEFYIFTDWRGFAFYYPIFADYLPVKNCIVWDKISGAGNFYSYSHEFIIFGCMRTKNKKGTNVWREKAFSSGARSYDGEKVHPTQKPTNVITRIIESGSEPGGVVLDTFMGSGTTAVCALRTGRHYIGFELAPDYHAIATKRVQAEMERLADDLLDMGGGRL